MSEPINLLWSGGFDSTYRLIELVTAGKTVRTLYIADMCGDPKQQLELAARTEILKQLPLELRRHIAEHVSIGRQHWATLYTAWKASIESSTGRTAGTNMSPQSPAMPAIASHLMQYVECCYVATDQANHGDVLSEMAGVVFPLLQRTKPDMLEAATRAGYRELLKLTWSCEWTDGKGTCGECVGCVARILDEQKELT